MCTDAKYTGFMDKERSPRTPGKTDAVYLQLKSDIEDGVFMPGETLPEIMLVERTGASRTPVREALRRLAADGLVEIAPRRPAVVSRISLRTVRELFDFRRIVEPAALRLVAQEAHESPVVKESFQALKNDFQQILNLDYNEEFATAFRTNARRFDDLLLQHTPNGHLSRSISELRTHTARLKRIAHTDHQRLNESIAEHIAMCEAITEGHGQRAAEILDEHLYHVDRAIFAALLDQQESGRSRSHVDLLG